MIPDPDSLPPTRLGSDPLAGLDVREALGAGLAPVAWEPPQPLELAAVLPEYEVYEVIGRGGMGVIYKARDVQLDRMVAIKLLPPELSNRADLVERFTREARALARLDHPNIVKVHDFSRTTAGHLYFVMEYVEGLDLSRLLRARDGKVPAKEQRETLEIIGQICGALQYAHSKGIVHRDIKPANVLITVEGQVKVADFGLARATEPVDGGTGMKDSQNMTLSGMIMGTLDYMAPEQREGLRVDHRADIYAVGVLLYQMLTGQLPRGAFLPPSRRTSGLDARLDKVVLKALQAEPDERYQRASEVRDAVQALHKLKTPPPPRLPAPRPGLGTGTEEPAGAEGLSSWLRRKPVPLMGGGAVLALLFGLGWHWWQGPDDGAAKGRFPTALAVAEALPAGMVVSDGIHQKAVPAEGALPLEGFFQPQSQPLILTCSAPGYQSQTITVNPGPAPAPLRILLEPTPVDFTWKSDPPGWFSAARLTRMSPPADPRLKTLLDLPPEGGRGTAGTYRLNGMWGEAAVPLGSETYNTAGPAELAVKWPLPALKQWSGVMNLSPQSYLTGEMEIFRKAAAAWEVGATVPFVLRFEPAGHAGLRVLNGRIVHVALLALMAGSLPMDQWRDEAAVATLFREKILLPLSFQKTSPTRLGSWFAALWKEQSRSPMVGGGEAARAAVFSTYREQAAALAGILTAGDVAAGLGDPKNAAVAELFFDEVKLSAAAGGSDRLRLEAAEAGPSLTMDWSGLSAEFLTVSRHKVGLNPR